MAIANHHFFDGAALSLITDLGEFTGLTLFPNVAGRAYTVNADIGIYIKHATTGTARWQFTFAPEHQTAVRDLFRRFEDKTFVVLVCAKVGICALPYGEYSAALDEDYTAQRALTVERPQGGGFRVRGQGGSVRRVVPLNNFPDCLFQ